MAPLCFILSLCFGGVLFISTAFTLDYCERVRISLKKGNLSLNITWIQTQSIANCYNLIFDSENSERMIQQCFAHFSIQSDSNVTFHITFTRNQQIEKSLIQFYRKNSEIGKEFSFDVNNGVRSICLVYLCRFQVFFLFLDQHKFYTFTSIKIYAHDRASEPIAGTNYRHQIR